MLTDAVHGYFFHLGFNRLRPVRIAASVDRWACVEWRDEVEP